jgi:hypothetical protein
MPIMTLYLSEAFYTKLLAEATDREISTSKYVQEALKEKWQDQKTQ